MWRSAWGCLLTRSALAAKNIPVTDVCPLCCANSESVHHLLFAYPVSRDYWSLAKLPVVSLLCDSIQDSLHSILSALSVKDATSFASIYYGLWLNHNLKVWKGFSQSVSRILNLAGQSLCNWQNARRCGAIFSQTTLCKTMVTLHGQGLQLVCLNWMWMLLCFPT